MDGFGCHALRMFLFQQLLIHPVCQIRVPPDGVVETLFGDSEDCFALGRWREGIGMGVVALEMYPDFFVSGHGAVPAA